MKKRVPLRKPKSKKIFRKGAKVHPKNYNPAPMRGGIRA